MEGNPRRNPASRLCLRLTGEGQPSPPQRAAAQLMEMKMSVETFTVCYRTGGHADCTWNKILVPFATREEANSKAALIEHAGYKANVYVTEELNRLGLPVGWQSDSVDWENDEILCSPYMTRHRKFSW